MTMPTTTLAEQVEAHAQAGTFRHGSQTMQTRRVIAALRGIGLHRSTFTVRTKRNASGEYGQALGHLRTSAAERIVAAHADELVACGLLVFITPRGHAFVGTPGPDQSPHVVRL